MEHFFFDIFMFLAGIVVGSWINFIWDEAIECFFNEDLDTDA